MRFRFAAAAAVLLLSSPALAQDVPPKVWDVPFGTPVSELGPDFVEPACGTDGGPPSVRLSAFADFANCPAEGDGLREIWFRYDDTIEYLARAQRNSVQSIRYNFNKVGMQPAILSFLVDDTGHIRGYRAHTDPDTDPRTRYSHYTASAVMRAVLAPSGWECADLPRLEGEGEVEGQFIKSHCELDTPAYVATNETRFYLKPGQAVVDHVTGKPMLNAFESSAWLTVRQKAPYSDPVLPDNSSSTAAPSPAQDSAIASFLAGETNSCVGCDLSGADLRRRDLTGADLSGATLVAVNLHRAILRQANFTGANLARSDLNLADLTQANFTDANLESATIFNARGAQTNFTGANLDKARAGSLDIRQANFTGASMQETDLGQARLNNGIFRDANLTGSYFYQANLVRADFTGARAERTAFSETVLRQAKLGRSNFSGADFQYANLLDADLSDADFSNVRFEMAVLRDTKQDGTNLSGSLMPDGTTAP